MDRKGKGNIKAVGTDLGEYSILKSNSYAAVGITGSEEQRIPGSEEQRIPGSEEQRIIGSME